MVPGPPDTPAPSTAAAAVGALPRASARWREGRKPPHSATHCAVTRVPLQLSWHVSARPPLPWLPHTPATLAPAFYLGCPRFVFRCRSRTLSRSLTFGYEQERW